MSKVVMFLFLNHFRAVDIEQFFLSPNSLNSLNVVFILDCFREIIMGLLYTKLYLNFDEDTWKQISNSPTTFEALDDNLLEVLDTSQNSKILQFKKGGKISLLRVVGKYRLTWNDDDLFN